jgi:hypothetical protein
VVFNIATTLQVVALHIRKSCHWRKGEEEESVLIPGRTVSWPRAAHMSRDLNFDLVHLDHAGIVVVEDCRLHCLTID